MTHRSNITKKCFRCNKYFNPILVEGQRYSKYCSDCYDELLKTPKKLNKAKIVFSFFVIILFSFILLRVIINMSSKPIEKTIAIIEVEDGTKCYIYKNMLSCNHGRYNAFTNCGEYPFAVDSEIDEKREE